MNRKTLPASIARVVRALKADLRAKVDVERVEGEDPWPDRFRIAVVSQRFGKMPHLKRQDLLWGIVDRELSREESIAISSILAFSPNELQRAVKA